jgi:peptidoglycan hydrolase-like protein with peptidoglycan-binding domain
MTRRTAALGSAFLVTLAAAGAAGAVIEKRHNDGAAATSAAAPATTANVTRTDLANTENVNGTLAFTGSHPVVCQAHGTLTALASEGTTVTRGETLFEVDGSAVVVMYGDRPAWRTLSVGVSDGSDVYQLDQNLIALGYATRQNLSPSNKYTDADAAAVKRWQRAMGVDQTGVVQLGSVIFLPGPIRIATHKLEVGASVGPGTTVTDATDTTRAVTVALDVAKQALVKTGDSVTVNLPNGATVAGTVTTIAKVATSSGNGGNNNNNNNSATINVTISIADQSQLGSLDSAPVQVAITTQSAKGVLAVPITALTALAQGGYAVDVVENGTRHRIPVTTGLFSNSMVEVSGSGLQEGQLVEVPSQ